MLGRPGKYQNPEQLKWEVGLAIIYHSKKLPNRQVCSLNLQLTQDLREKMLSLLSSQSRVASEKLVDFFFLSNPKQINSNFLTLSSEALHRYQPSLLRWDSLDSLLPNIFQQTQIRGRPSLVVPTQKEIPESSPKLILRDLLTQSIIRVKLNRGPHKPF